MIKLVHIIWDADLRGRQPGLAAQMKTVAKLKPTDLDPGELVVFVNRKRDKIAVLAGVSEEESLGVMGYYCSPSGRVDTMALQYIPQSFGANGRMDMNEATRKAILERLKKKGRDYGVTKETRASA